MIRRWITQLAAVTYECTGCGATFTNLDAFLSHSC
jgi:hypothetical protein